MTGTPAAEIQIDAELGRRLLTAQHPDLAHLPVSLAASGWDNSIFRLGDELALRLPRRQMAVDLLRHEQAWLPRLAASLPLAIPAPVRIGAPQDGYPWPWSVIPWIEGETADLSQPDADQGAVLGAFFKALHLPAPADAPRNPYRGTPLAHRLEAFEARIEGLARRGWSLDPRVQPIWDEALAASNDAEPTWIQGDPHPRNVLVRDGKLAAVIDWGDMASGDRASDLSAIWMLLPERESRAAAMEACGPVSDDTWRRARGWAVLYGVILKETGLADDPRMQTIADRIFARLIEGP